MSVTEKEKQFLLIATTHIRELHDSPSINLSSVGEVCSHADDYVKLGLDYIRVINGTKEAYHGIEREKILEMYEDRKIFHAEKARGLAQEALDRVILCLSDERVDLTRKALRDELLRRKFDKALHDVGTRIDGEWQGVDVYGGEVDRERLPPLSCHALSENDLDALDGYFSKIGECRTRIEALEKIRVELGRIGPNEEQRYFADPEKVELGTVSDLGDLLFQEWIKGERSRSNLVTHGVNKYSIRERPDYRWKPNVYREAVNKSLKRRIEKHEQKEKSGGSSGRYPDEMNR
jgi:hypothetical protein